MDWNGRFMMRLQMIAIETMAAAMILAPLMMLGQRLFSDKKKLFYYLIFTLYLSAVYVAVGLPTITYVRFELNLNFIPLIGIINDLKNSILNVILFIPLGIALPLFWVNYHSIRQVILFGFGMSLSIELLQIFTYRATDVNDLLTNTLGTVLGYFMTKSLMDKRTFMHPNQSNRDLYILNTTVFAVMFFIHPFVSPLVWTLFD